MKLTAFIGSVAVSAAIALAPAAQASVMIDPISVSSPSGDFGGAYALVNLINQSGLSVGYTSGVTDFATYTATTLHDSTSAGSPSGFTGAGGLPQTITFNFSGPISIGSIAIWAVQNVGSITQFSLSGDGGAIAGVFNAAADNGTGIDPAQDFFFAPQLTSKITMTVLDTAGGPSLFPGLGAVAFGSGGAIPEPTSWALMLVGFGGVGAAMRRRRTQVGVQAA